jgi:hypothetical protein
MNFKIKDETQLRRYRKLSLADRAKVDQIMRRYLAACAKLDADIDVAASSHEPVSDAADLREQFAEGRRLSAGWPDQCHCDFVGSGVGRLNHSLTKAIVFHGSPHQRRSGFPPSLHRPPATDHAARSASSPSDHECALPEGTAD